MATQNTSKLHDVIRVVGASENNLHHVTVDIPKRKLTVFTGVSGSGKSSLVFGTIAAEAQRSINETYNAFVQGFMQAPSRPDVDRIEGITAAISVDQSSLGGGPRSTVGTVTDALAYLRLLFSRVAEPHIGGPKAYSFNQPTVTGGGAIKKAGQKKGKAKRFTVIGGQCVTCEGMGTVTDLKLTELFDDSLSLNDGALTIPGYKAGGWSVRQIVESGFVNGDKPIKDFTDKEMHDFLYREPERIKINNVNRTYEGLVLHLKNSMLSKDRESMQPHIREFVDRAVTYKACPDCHGTRLNEGARTSTIDGVSIADATGMQINELAEWVKSLDKPQVKPVIENLLAMLDTFVDSGLGYLSLDRPAGTLSGGEAQRTKMVRHVNSALTDATYIFDEPTAGLHPHDIERMNALLLRLRDKGNTVLVVEHKPETIAIADHVIDMGPGAGKDGGMVCFEGTVEQLRESSTATGTHLHDSIRLKDALRESTGEITIDHASFNNLDDVTVSIPLGELVAVTGVAGSGKSSLMSELRRRSAEGASRESSARGGGSDGNTTTPDQRLVYVDQSPIKGGRRSNPATYTGMLDPIRKSFAKANNVTPSLFSANSEGACPSCHGLGTIDIDLGMMGRTSSTCEDCAGRGFSAEVLDYTLGGSTIADVMAMTVDQALPFCREAKVRSAVAILRRLSDVGLGYLTIGQPLSTLSGGELQRLKLAVHMADDGGVYVLDEPTNGLHMQDVDKLLTLLDKLVDSGKSVVVVEHHQAVMAHADWLIDLGPGAGDEGGQVVFEGTPRELVEQKEPGLTGRYLREAVRA
ncbi:excinuclease ABC subunit UvrA [Corynebacterium pseudokroppenstedtii]|uniref:excinuclease ABC subunit UvrA n=1 Tax=Corynebacterium pseudokroppenstedtii TaxID=2804917 RepID=UPI0030790F3A